MLFRGITVVAVLAMWGAPVSAAGPVKAPDLSKVSRKIGREPKYVSPQPLYGLYVFGPDAKTEVWAVLDKSGADKNEYDVLYFDRNADSDLTGADERIVGTSGERSNGVKFGIGEFTDRKTGEVHTEVSISRRTDGSVFLRMLSKGRDYVMGGYAEESGPYCRFATSPEQAPVLWPGADGTFSFQRWIWKELPVGGSGDVRVFMGHEGLGKNTFCAVRQDFLPPDVPVLATLVYTDTDGKEQRALSKLRERC